jgi:rhodanese-related sulfurtransferase
MERFQIQLATKMGNALRQFASELESNGAMLVDIREADELAREGAIPGVVHALAGCSSSGRPAFTSRDRAGLSDLLADPIDVRGITPRRFWEGTTSRDMVDEILFGHWLDDNDQVTELMSVATGRVGDREHVAYRFRLENRKG